MLRGVRRHMGELTGLLLLLAARVGGGIHGLPTELEVSQASLMQQLAEVIMRARTDQMHPQKRAAISPFSPALRKIHTPLTAQACRSM